VPILYVNIKFLVKELHLMSFHIQYHATLITAVIDGCQYITMV